MTKNTETTLITTRYTTKVREENKNDYLRETPYHVKDRMRTLKWISYESSIS